MAINIVYRLKVLSKLDVDLFGKCWDGRSSHSSEHLYKKYKFYLALGNEWHCRDFLNLDIWQNAFVVGAVPIIWGPKRIDVEKALPRNSFLFLEDFASAFELTNYLEYLHKNNEAFEQYLNWRRKPFEEEFSNQLEYRANNGHCQLCSKLHDLDSNSAYKVTSLYEWWIKSNSPYCVDSKYFAASMSKFFHSRLEWLSLKIFSSFPTIFVKPNDFFLFFKVTLELFLCFIVLDSCLYQKLKRYLAKNVLS